MKHFIGSYSLPDVTYHKPEDLEEALILLKDHRGNCKLIAGCTDVIPDIRRGVLTLAEGSHLIDVRGIEGLKTIAIDQGQINIGAAATFSAILQSSVIIEQSPLLAEVSRDLGSLQVKNAGTVGGNLCTASPGADSAVALLALDARVIINGLGHEKTVPLDEFFIGPGKTILDNNEILTRVQFPAMGPDEKYCWVKIGRRKAFTMPVITVATRVSVVDGMFDMVRIALGVAGPTPLRVEGAEDYLLGKEATIPSIEEAAEIASKEVRPRSSFRASAEYRRDMARVLTKRALASCLGLAQK